MLTSLRLIRTARKTGIRKLHYTLIIFNLNSWNGGQTFGQSRPNHFTQKVGHGDLRLETRLNLASLVSRIYLLWAQNMSTMAGLGVLESEAPAQVPSMPAWWQWKRKPFLCDKRQPMIGSRDPDFAAAGVWPPKCGGNHRSALGMASQLVVCHPCQFESWVEAFFVIDFLQVLCFRFGWCFIVFFKAQRLSELQLRMLYHPSASIPNEGDWGIYNSISVYLSKTASPCVAWMCFQVFSECMDGLRSFASANPWSKEKCAVKVLGVLQ